MTNFTDKQLKDWAVCTEKHPEPITQDMWIERVSLFAEAKQHAPALARELLKTRVEVAKLRKALDWIEDSCFVTLNSHDQDKTVALEGIQSVAETALERRNV